MSVALLQAFGLIALLGVVVPIVLHLARRSEHHAIDFAALRWLSSRARPRRRIRVVERGLLALRLLLIGLLALLLAAPVLMSSDRGRAWTVIAPGVDPASIPGRRAEDGITWRWLAPGFPGLDSVAPRNGAHIASLLRELDASLPLSTSLTVWVPREMSGLDGARMQLNREVAWRIAPGRAPASAVQHVAPFAFAVRHEADRIDGLRFLRAAAQAWSANSTTGVAAGPGPAAGSTPSALLDIAETVTVPQRRDAALVWLRAGALPPAVRAWVDGGGTLLIEPRTPWVVDAGKSAIVWRTEAGRPLARAMRVGRGRVVRLEVPLTATGLPAVMDGSFAAALRELLQPRELRPDRAFAMDHAPGRQPSTGKRSQVPAGSGRELAPWLALVVAALFLLERLLASSARRWHSE